MRRLKIAFISRRYWEENHFGGEEGGATQQLAECVAAMGHEVVVLSQSPQVRKLKKVAIGNLETWVSPRGRHRNLVVAVRDRLARKAYFQPQIHSDVMALRDFLAKRGPFDAIWAHEESPDGLTVALAARKKIKVPPLLVQIQHLPCKYVKGAPVFIEKVPLDLAFRQASRILASSELVVTSLPKYASPGHSADDLRAKVRVVYPNIQRPFMRNAMESPDVPAAMKDRVLFLGALNQHKGALTFLRAIAKTEAAKRNAIFAVAGEFTDYNKRFVQHWEETKESTRINLPGARMEYLGHVSTEEVIRQIKLSRVVVIPYRFDAFARGLVEALVLGRPVITTDQVGAASIVTTHQCGIVVPPNDPEALAQAIDVILSPVVPFTDNAVRVGQSLANELAPEAIAPYIAYHLTRIAAPEK
jgi:glycosyltransferase involved in cell wall biosynthesis